MQHAGHAHVMHKGQRAGRLRRQIDTRRRGADNPVLRDRLDGDIVGERKPDAVGRRSARRRLCGDCPRRTGRTTPSSTMSSAVGTPKISAARAARNWRAWAAARLQRDCAELDRLAGDRRPLIGRDRGVAEHHGNALEGDVQFLRDDLRERRPNAGAEIDMPAEGRHFARRRDKHEGRERFRGRALESGIPGRRLRRRRACPASPDNPRGAVAVAEAAVMRGRELAASRTAAIISTCAPQRQRLKRSASRISASEGSGFASSRARADMIMPFRQ